MGALSLLVAVVTLAPDRGLGRRGTLDIYDNWSVLPLMRCLGGFIIGLLAARAVRAPALARIAARPWCSLAAAASILVMMEVRAPDLLIYPLLPLLVAALHRGRGPLQRGLAASWPYHLGVLSYALYLVHYPIMNALPRDMPAPLGFAAGLALGIGVAHLAHHWVEQPARTSFRRWSIILQARLSQVALR